MSELLLLFQPASATPAGSSPPANISAPVISGSANVGATLVCVPGTWSGNGIAYGYQWRRGGAAISNATNSTYTTSSDDFGSTIDCVVTATNAYGSASQTSNDVTAFYDFLAGTLSPALTQARASTATYFNESGTLVTASNDAARFDYDPAALALRGILVEPSRQNLVAYAVPQDAHWTVSNMTGDWGLYASPDGGTAASKLSDTTIASFHYARPTANISYVSGNTYTGSVFAKAGTATMIQLTFPSSTFGSAQYANFNLSTGVCSATGGTAGMQALSNGYYRCWFTVIATGSAATTAMQIVLVNSMSANRLQNYTGTGQYLYLWGVQIEIGSWPSSYVATAGSASTRAADQLSLTVPTGVATLRYLFDDSSTQDLSVSAGAYTVPTSLNRAWIKGISKG